MTTLPAFNGMIFRAIERDGEPWITSNELAKALGYARPDFIAQIFRRNADEFTTAMTALVPRGAERQVEVLRAGVEGQFDVLPGDGRIFSLRGAHLIAMFAKTPVAASFRRWVLDLLDARAHRLQPPPDGPAGMILDLLGQRLAGLGSVTVAEAAGMAGMPDDPDGRKAVAHMLRMLGWRKAWVPPATPAARLAVGG